MTAPDGFYEGLGSSVVPAIMGLDSYKSPYKLWLEFTDPTTREDLSANEAVEAGIEMEDGIAKWAAKRWGYQIEYRPARIIHPRIRCMQAHVDRFVIAPELAVLEVKNRGLMMGRRYDESSQDEAVREIEAFVDDIDRIQPTEAIQVMAQLAVTGYDTGLLAVLIGGQKLLRFRLNRDEGIIAKIEEACERFWDCVQTGVPPEPVNLSDVDRRWREHSPGAIAIADDALLAVYDQRVALKKTEKETKDALEFVNFQIKNAMREAEELRHKGKKLISWKSHQREFFDTSRFKADNPDLAAQYTEEKTVRVLR